MFKTMIIMILAIVLLIIVGNSLFGFGGISLPELPVRSTETQIEQRLMSAARLIEEAKTDKVLRVKVKSILKDW